MIKKIKKFFYKKNGVEQNEINKQLLITVISVFVTVISVIGVSFAAFVWSDNSEKEQKVAVGNINLTISSDSDPLGSGLNYPVDTADVDNLKPYTFTITNSGSLAANYTLKLVDDTAAISSDGCSSNQIDKSYIYLNLNGAKTLGDTQLSTLTNNVLDSGVIMAGESKTFDLRLWLYQTAPNSVMGQHYHGKIQLETSQVEGDEPTQYKDESNANPPVLASGMIPVVYDETNDVWVKADITEKWYNYGEQMWANAVTVDNCIPGGDLNNDGVINMSDYDLLMTVYGGKSSDSDIAYEADLDGDGDIGFADYNDLFYILEGDDHVNYCTSPAKSRKTAKQREYYQNAEPGTEIQMEDINAMWVWIPRFKYKIATNLGSSSNLTEPPQIDVVFEEGISATGVTEDAYRAGMSATADATNTNYYTHPAFRDIDNITYSTDTAKTSDSRGAWDEELTGFWVGKFETGTGNYTCNSSSTEANCKDSDTNIILPIIKPDVKSLRYQNVSTQFLTSLKFAGGTMDTTTGEVTFKGSDTYGLTASTDTHMMKNTEWGAVAYLSQSKYGKNGNTAYTTTANKEVYINNSSGYYTGRSYGSVAPSSSVNGTTNGTYSYNDKSCTTVTTNTLGNTCTGSKTTNAGQGASTTGNMYGVYDMSGGADEYTMGNWSKSTSSDGFNIFPDTKYYDLYKGTSSTSTTMLKSIMGDATWETARWYSDGPNFISTSWRWFRRSGSFYVSQSYGVFYLGAGNGANGDAYGLYSFRTTLIP